jgi:hypothetical protein
MTTASFIVALLAVPAVAPEERAIAYLEREVPAWSTTNKCFSCHNNGTGARALFAAAHSGFAVSEKATANTIHWLSQPAGWDHNGGDQPYNDKRLARLQFTLALLEATEAGIIRDRKPLQEAVEAIVKNDLEVALRSSVPDGIPGSPTTFGSSLFTAELRGLLFRTDFSRYREEIRRADERLRNVPIKTVLDASAVLLGLGKSDDPAASRQRSISLALLRKGELKGGGWGAYTHSSPEAFDTALAVLSLSQQPRTDEIRAYIQRGRAYLLQTQSDDGSWPETTRPAREISYAEHIATTGWATRALLATK